jgi:hypothetical protein
MQFFFSSFVKERWEDIQRFHKEVMKEDSPLFGEEISLETNDSKMSLVLIFMDEEGMKGLYWIPFAYFDDVDGYITQYWSEEEVAKRQAEEDAAWEAAEAYRANRRRSY